MEDPIRVPSLESVITSSTEGQSGTSSYNINAPALEISDMGPWSSGILILQVAITSSDNHSSRTKSVKSPFSENKNWNLMAWRVSGVYFKLNVCQILPLKLSFPKNNESSE
ncbi:hypothetical protein AYI69_g711 [Smittium culicis]|uniref:Uncharacterized protein n=1 Tax=Smittium culicis TaxID=133412 RepID=A0A1R1XW78_9FUNG|nr:hypothetical protein AYI69_g6871 [Smittium culicis]OMJ29770.1 hypothetical protein AYI69_g711 [Smittium culicis]